MWIEVIEYKNEVEYSQSIFEWTNGDVFSFVVLYTLIQADRNDLSPFLAPLHYKKGIKRIRDKNP